MIEGGIIFVFTHKRGTTYETKNLGGKKIKSLKVEIKRAFNPCFE
jgi:hypothetical protein